MTEAFRTMTKERLTRLGVPSLTGRPFMPRSLYARATL
jgi:hypothetical protein